MAGQETEIKWAAIETNTGALAVRGAEGGVDVVKVT